MRGLAVALLLLCGCGERLSSVLPRIQGTSLVIDGADIPIQAYRFDCTSTASTTLELIAFRFEGKVEQGPALTNRLKISVNTSSLSASPFALQRSDWGGVRFSVQEEAYEGPAPPAPIVAFQTPQAQGELHIFSFDCSDEAGVASGALQGEFEDPDNDEILSVRVFFNLRRDQSFFPRTFFVPVEL